MLLAVGALAYARALSAVFDARLRRITADAQDETVAASADALDEIAQRRELSRRQEAGPTDDELYRQILDEREYTTTANEGVEEETGISPDRMYVPEEADG